MPAIGEGGEDTLYDRVVSVLSEHGDRDLETYLLALYRLAELHQGERMTEGLFFSLLADAFTAEPAPFEDAWLENPCSPDLSTASADPREGYTYTTAVLRFQIADLHLMRGRQLEDDLRYYGLDSPTGHVWYNFDPIALLECGAAGLTEAQRGLDDIDWSLLGKLLEVGRIYE